MKLILSIRGIKVLKISFIFVLILQLTVSIFVFQPPKAHAGSLTELSDTMSSQYYYGYSDHTIKFKIATPVNGPTDTITVNLYIYAVDGTNYTDMDLSHGTTTGYETEETLASSAAAGVWGVSQTFPQDFTVTFTAPTDAGVTEIPANDYVVIEIGLNASSGDHQLANPEVGNFVCIIAGTFGDTGKIAYVTLANDRVGVTATVDPTLSFSISDITVGFGSFVSTNIRYATGDVAGSASEPAADNPTKLVVSTNGDNGATITVQDEGSGSSSGLWSAAPISELIASDTSRNIIVVGNKKKYGLYGKNASTLVIHENFDNDATDSALTRAAQTFASYTGPMSSASLDLVPVAAVDATTKAGAYTDTITIICTVNF